MNALKKLIALYLIGLAVVVAVHFMFGAVYHEPGSAEYPIWQVLNWFQAVSIIIALIVHLSRKLDLGGDATDLISREYLAANLAFYGSIVLAIWFFWNWLSLFFPTEAPRAAQAHENIWPFINPMVVILTSAAGIHLWRTRS